MLMQISRLAFVEPDKIYALYMDGSEAGWEVYANEKILLKRFPTYSRAAEFLLDTRNKLDATKIFKHGATKEDE